MERKKQKKQPDSDANNGRKEKLKDLYRTYRLGGGFFLLGHTLGKLRIEKNREKNLIGGGTHWPAPALFARKLGHTLGKSRHFSHENRALRGWWDSNS
jgi:hypothetical protein